MISQNTITEIFEISKVEEVVGDFVNLKKRGSNMLGLCPFHNEKTPSFTVSPSKNIYKCFGCGRGGNAVNFLMEHEHFTYPEALKYLAKKYKIEIEETYDPRTKEDLQLRESYFIINEFAQNFFHDQLFNADEGTRIALPYFKERGLLEKTILKFGLGYNPNGTSLTQKALKDGYKLDFLKTLGLTNKSEGDFFRGRVMFPFYNLSGNVIGFGGRIMSSSRGPKYLNSPESEVYNKKKTLYGLYQARKQVRIEDNLYLVEGYTDVLSLSQAGIENVVASSGTSLTEEQVHLIKRFSSRVTILYDGDPAGIKAALRGIDLILEKDLNVFIVMLPEGQDPDSWIRAQGKDAFLKYVEDQKKDFIHFKIDLLRKEAKADPLKKTALIKDIVQSISKIPDAIKRSVYVQRSAIQLEIQEEILINEINQTIRKDLYKKQNRRRAEADFPPESSYSQETQIIDSSQVHKPKDIAQNDEFQEKDIVRLFMTAAHVELKFENEETQILGNYLVDNLEEVMDSFDNDRFKEIIELCRSEIRQGKILSPDFFLHHPDTDIQKLAVDFNSSKYNYSDNWLDKLDIALQTQPVPEKNFKKDSYQSIMRFKLRKIKKMIDQNKEDLIKASEEKDAEKIELYMKVAQNLDMVKSQIAKELNTVIV